MRAWCSTASIEVPVTIRDPGKRIGTHVFTAMAKTDAGLRWTAVTIDEGDSARSALDRITIPKDVLDRIAPTALPRSSIIISDEPLSAETNYRTEFVAVLSNQPQGGFITRERTPEVAVSDAYGDDDRFGWFSQRGWGAQSGNSPRRGWGGWDSQTGPERGGSQGGSYQQEPAQLGMVLVSRRYGRGPRPSPRSSSTSTQSSLRDSGVSGWVSASSGSKVRGE